MHNCKEGTLYGENINPNQSITVPDTRHFIYVEKRTDKRKQIGINHIKWWLPLYSF
jgi:hypothetical protein